MADLDDTHEVYGIVTNFRQWIFLKSLDKEVLFDGENTILVDAAGIPIDGWLMDIVGKIYSILS